MTVRERIRIIRQYKKISTYELSRLTGLGQSAISRMESGERKISVDDLILISEALKTPVEAFFYDDKMLNVLRET